MRGADGLGTFSQQLAPDAATAPPANEPPARNNVPLDCPETPSPRRTLDSLHRETNTTAYHAHGHDGGKEDRGEEATGATNDDPSAEERAKHAVAALPGGGVGGAANAVGRMKCSFPGGGGSGGGQQSVPRGVVTQYLEAGARGADVHASPTSDEAPLILGTAWLTSGTMHVRVRLVRHVNASNGRVGETAGVGRGEGETSTGVGAATCQML